MTGDDNVGTQYLYAAPDALGVSGGQYSDNRLTYRTRTAAASDQLWLDWAQPGTLRLISTHEANLILNLAALTGAQQGPVTLTPSQQFGLDGLTVHLHMQPDVWYTVRYTPGPVPALDPALPRPALAAGWYILAAGHNVLPPFLGLWQRLDAGLPIDEQRSLPDGAVQYFTNLAMRSKGGTVTLLPLGLEALGGRPAPAARELPKKTKHLYVTATGHNLRGAFLSYWRATGGAAIWGDPISEEIARGGRTVQYFANAEMVWDGSAVTLAPLGADAWAAGAR
jgi:hypothetical protein